MSDSSALFRLNRRAFAATTVLLCFAALASARSTPANAQDTTVSTTTQSTSTSSATTTIVTTQGGAAGAQSAITIADGFHLTPFQSIDDAIIVKVQINGKTKGLMAFDTGSYTYLTPAAAQSLALKLTPDPDNGPHSQSGALERIRIGEVELRDVPLNVQPSTFVDTWNKQHLALPLLGILGMDAVSGRAVGIDFPSRTMGWWPKGNLTPDVVRSFNSLVHNPDDASGVLTVLMPGQSVTIRGRVLSNPPLIASAPQSVPLFSKEDDYHYYMGGVLDGLPLEMMLDTGSDDIHISQDTGRKLRLLSASKNAIQGFNDQFGVTMGLAHSFVLGGLTFRCPIVDFVAPGQPRSQSTGPDVPLLGVYIFKRCRLVIDFPARILYVSPQAGFNRTGGNVLLTMGLTLHSLTNPQLVVDTVAKGAAANAGVRDGDELTAINGVPFAEFHFASDAAYKDKMVTLTVRRKGQAKPLDFAVPFDATAF